MLMDHLTYKYEYIISPEFLRRFWTNVDIPEEDNDCWLWTGFKNKNGYGKIYLIAEKEYVHRIAYVIQYKDIPHGIKVLHKCDNPLCVNPNHLFLGTQQDNLKDMREKGRGKDYIFTDEAILDIRNQGILGVPQRVIAAEYNISQRLVNKIINKISHGHVKDK